MHFIIFPLEIFLDLDVRLMFRSYVYVKFNQLRNQTRNTR